MPENEVTLQKLSDEINKVYLINDPYIIKLLVAASIAQFISADPIWIVIVAPSGGNKSSMIELLSLIKWTPKGENKKTQHVHPVSTLTSHTFISGFKSNTRETSFILQVGSGIITFKDLTSLLSEHKDDRAIIMAQLREIYDGKYSKRFGTGEEIKWDGKITIIAGATYAIHSLKQSYAAMGERFIFYNLIQPDRQEAAEWTMRNQEEGKMTEHRQHLAEITAKYTISVLNNMPLEIPKMNSKTRAETISIAEMATRARSDVERNYRSPQQEVTEVHPPEMPTRFAGQLQTMIQSLKVINFYETGKFELQEEDKQIINKLALDSVTKMRRIMMQQLSKFDTITTTGIAIRLGLPTNSVRRYLEDLVALEIADREKGMGASGDRWNIKPKYRALMTFFENIQFEGSELNADNAENDLPENQRLKIEAEEAKIEEETLIAREQEEFIFS